MKHTCKKVIINLHKYYRNVNKSLYEQLLTLDLFYDYESDCYYTYECCFRNEMAFMRIANVFCSVDQFDEIQNFL